MSNQNGGNDSPTPSFKAIGMPYLDINFRCHPAAGALQVLCVHGGAQHLSERLPRLRSLKKTALCGSGMPAIVSRFLIARDSFNLRQPVFQDDKFSRDGDLGLRIRKAHCRKIPPLQRYSVDAGDVFGCRGLLDKWVLPWLMEQRVTLQNSRFVNWPVRKTRQRWRN